MEVDRTPFVNPSVDYERPGVSYEQGKYAGFNPLFAGNEVAPSKAADWNWLSLHFSPLQSSLQAGGTLNLSGATLANPRIFGATFPDKTQGSVLFIGPGSVLAENNASFFWDNTNLSLNQDNGALAANVAHRFRVAADTQNRLQISAGGTLSWGSGSAAVDLSLTRLSANPGVAILQGVGGTAALTVDNVAATVRDFRFSTAGVNRWIIRANQTAEGGANAGSDFLINARDDTGANLVSNAFFITRATGFVGINTGGPDRRLDVLDASNPQLRLTTADGSTFTDFQDSSGVLTISPSANSIVFSNGTKTLTSGTTIGLSYTETFSDGGTNSSTVAQCLTLAPTINFSAGTKTGRAYGIYLSPTATSLPTGLNSGIAFSNAFTASGFAPIRVFNTSDELTNAEYFEEGFHITANNYVLRTNRIGTGTMRVLDIAYGGAATAAVRVPTTTSSPVQLGLHGTKSTAGTTVAIAGSGSGNVTATSGTEIGLDIAESFAPSSTSTMIGYGLNWTPTINFSAGTPGAGYVYGLYLKPTNTALPTGISAAIALGSTASGINGIVWNNQSDEQTNYEHVKAYFTGNIWTIASVKGGTGTLRGINIGIAGNSIGFYGTAPTALQTGVAVTAAGIHAALVTLGLITA